MGHIDKIVILNLTLLVGSLLLIKPEFSIAEPHIFNSIPDNLDPRVCIGLDDAVCGNVIQLSNTNSLNLSQEKDLLIKFFSFGDLLPKHDLIFDWNKMLTFSMAPEGVEVSSLACPDIPSADCILNSWVRTFAAMPSYIETSASSSETDAIFINGTGEILTGYSYDLDTPPDYIRETTCACEEPPTNPVFPNDCKTIYSYEDLSTLKADVNGQQLLPSVTNTTELGGRQDYHYTTRATTNLFSSTLTVTNRIYRDHWSWNSAGSCDICCRSCECDEGPCGCCDYAEKYVCTDYTGKDHVDIVLELSHELDKATLFKDQVFNQTLVYDTPTTIPEGTLVTDARDFKLQLTKGDLLKDGSMYSVNYRYAPYDILWVERNNKTQYFSEDLVVGKSSNESDVNTIIFTTYTHNLESCSFNILRPFEPYSKSYACVTRTKTPTSLKVKSDKSSYLSNEKINLEINFSDNLSKSANISLKYGLNTTLVEVNPGMNTFELIPQNGFKSITATFEGDENRSHATSIPLNITVRDESAFKMILELTFTFVLFFFIFKTYTYYIKKTIQNEL